MLPLFSFNDNSKQEVFLPDLNKLHKEWSPIPSNFPLVPVVSIVGKTRNLRWLFSMHDSVIIFILTVFSQCCFINRNNLSLVLAR